MTAPELAPVCEIVVELGEPRGFGLTRDGERRFTPIVGGELRGIADAEIGDAVRALRAEILPGGGDRQLVRAASSQPDGTTALEIDARYDARSPEGALIGVHATGIRRAGVSGVYFRAMIRFETADPALAELQDALFVADGVREADRVRHTVYRLT
ncbi:DUF3237 domain-containing protein [Leucobacter tenebrionis]|uniref:DUF3237 domain-containing protein n=1 Tax=Leucobacter tenebrionis TaxID=2873270 RepID=UPI001CA60B81|nr:DUF3237 domain-containing protein [Leucobacter tenebrionis]QZY51707.1 DUF3237 domain-containing protein [Leucobacter tenebrionis]